jgi:co-chaperonin GroES (HSP10)
MLKVVGPNALIDPIATPRSDLITLTDRMIPVVGRIVALGTVRCPECGMPAPPDVAPGALVLVPPTAGQEIVVDDHAYWLIPIRDLVAEWKESV